MAAMTAALRCKPLKAHGNATVRASKDERRGDGLGVWECNGSDGKAPNCICALRIATKRAKKINECVVQLIEVVAAAAAA